MRNQFGVAASRQSAANCSATIQRLFPKRRYDRGATRSVLECGDASPLFPGTPGTGRAGSPQPAVGLRVTLAARWGHHALPVLWLLLALPVFAQTDYTNKWFTVDGGGRSSTGGVYTITGTAGQPDAGVMQRGEYTVNNGFWGIIAVVQMPGAPLLMITLNPQLSTITLSWPYPSEGYGLQQCTNLTTANWLADTNVPAQVGNEWQVTVSPPQTGKRYYQYYRLQKP